MARHSNGGRSWNRYDMGAWIALGLLVVAGVVLLVNHDTGTIAGFGNANFAGIVTALALLIYLGGSLLRGYRGGFTGALRDAVLWALFALVLIAGYSYRDQLGPVANRVASELLPGTPFQVEPGNGKSPTVRIRKQRDGQFIAKAMANKASLNMIIDTGASVVVLTQSDAQKAGIDVTALSYSVPMQTANGITMGARIKLSSVSVGTIALRNVDALVAKPGSLRESLLGMSFLSRLRSYEFSGDFLTLRS